MNKIQWLLESVRNEECGTATHQMCFVEGLGVTRSGSQFHWTSVSVDLPFIVQDPSVPQTAPFRLQKHLCLARVLGCHGGFKTAAHVLWQSFHQEMGFLSLPPRPGLACDCFDEQLTGGVMWITSSHSILPLKRNRDSVTDAPSASLVPEVPWCIVYSLRVFKLLSLNTPPRGRA